MSKNLTDNWCRSQLEVVIREWINGPNADRNRRLVARRLFDGVTFERLAEEFGLSPRQTRTIYHKCEQIIYRHAPG